MKTAIFLGAGASKADNAPIQTEIFKEYFSLPDYEIANNPIGMNQELQLFFKDFFNIEDTTRRSYFSNL